MTAPIKRDELPAGIVRRAWGAKILVGPDITDILGAGPNATDLAVASGVATKLLNGMLQEAGSIESIEILQNRNVQERFAFGPNPLQPFQVAPQVVSVTLKLSKVVLINPSKSEKYFNFYPSNLLHQQMPFVIYLRDANGGVDNAIQHFFFGCWFADSAVKYTTIERSDVRLIQSATVRPTRMLTLDNTFAGNPETQTITAGTAILANYAGVAFGASKEELLDDFSL